MSFRLIDELQTKAIPVAQSCRVLGVSRSGFYQAKRRAAVPMICKASVHVRAAFVASHQSYGVSVTPVPSLTFASKLPSVLC